ncbi:MAG: hypothetical protein HKM24_00005, partial [Gammaproteobacteria bacterium]|nr:hypothetical protein [Gammaproteobacteria bacterium]
TEDCASDQWVIEAALVCDAATDNIDDYGYHTDRYAQWNDETGTANDAWESLDDTMHAASDYVECQDDFGIHGDGTANFYWAAKKGWGPFYDSNNKSKVHKWTGSTMSVYSSNYLNFLEDVGETPSTQLAVVQYVAKQVLAEQSGVNVGFMQFDSSSNGGMIVHEIASIDTNLASINTTIDELKGNGNTPMAETMYEAYRYFASEAPEFGFDATRGGGCAWGWDGPNHCPSVPASNDGTNYISPIDEPCDRNFIIYLSDGDPVGDSSADTAISTLTGFSCAAPGDNCVDDLADHMANEDVNADIDLEQNVRTYTIGFTADHPLMESTAERGGGAYFRADDMAQLDIAFTEIFNEIMEIDFTFVSPTVSVNTFNRLTHNSELYYNIYRPSLEPSWPGNLKRYKLGFEDNRLTILDSTDQEAIDPETGFFKESAKSFWTLGSDPDGFDTELGGLASRLHADRNVYTNKASWNLWQAGNELHEDNAAITAAELGAVDAAEREAVLRWARGVDGSGNPTYELRDALHSKPTIMSWGGTVDDPDLTLFYSDNVGFAHAIDINNSSSENLHRFSFILATQRNGNLRKAYLNTIGSPTKMYGADGPITGYIYNDDGDGVVESSEGEIALVAYGTRRYTRNILALDVTNRDQPKIKWNKWNSTPGFSEMGKTWSRLTPATVKLNGVDKEVFLMGGGYDPVRDSINPWRADNQGRAIFMLDALTGNILWWAANATDHPTADLPLSDMVASIPSDMAVI